MDERLVEGIVLIQNLDEFLGGYFVVSAFQVVVAAVHTSVRMGDGNRLETLDLLDGFL